MRRVISLPDEGRLLVATDLQGNLGDYLALEAIFEEASNEGPTHLVITGDLVHGPELEPHQWPEYLGTFYRGDSAGLLRHARALAERHPGRVHYLLGNHEHAHVGGPVVAKFFPDEANRLEEILGPETASVRAWIASWPFVAVATQARLAMLHAAPHVVIKSADDLERLSLDGFVPDTLDALAARGALPALLWARTTSTERGHAFLEALDPNLCVAIYGHDVARSGFSIDRDPLLCISTSFGCHDGDKLYLDWDLSEPAQSPAHVAARGLKPLHPNATPVYRRP